MVAGDERQHHDGQHQAGGQDADAERRTLEQPADAGQRSEVLDQPRLHVPLQDGREHEQAPDAEDDAGHGGEQLHRDADRALQPGRTQFGEEQRNAEAGRHRQHHGDQRGHKVP